MSTAEQPTKAFPRDAKKKSAFMARLWKILAAIIIVIMISNWWGSINWWWKNPKSFNVEAGQDDYTFIVVRVGHPARIGPEFEDDATESTVEGTLDQVVVRWLYPDGTATPEEPLRTAINKTYTNITGGAGKSGFLVRMDDGPIKGAEIRAQELQ
jgi:hypothetical protein